MMDLLQTILGLGLMLASIIAGVLFHQWYTGMWAKKHGDDPPFGLTIASMIMLAGWTLSGIGVSTRPW